MAKRLPRIGIDLMGSDTPPLVLLEAVVALNQDICAEAELVIFATADIASPHIQTVVTSDIIHMDDDPLLAVRRKKGSSLHLGLQMLGNKQIDAFVTGGNTGALLACAKLFAPMLPGIDRPALMTLLPTQKTPLAVLDVGANVNCKPHHLVQFAHMGIAYQESRGVAHPRVALLNNGTEETKGTAELKEAHQLLKSLPHFVGNKEPRDVFSGDIDVLVTDGFTGNIFLKTAEGVGTYILNLLEHTAPPPLRTHLNYAEYPGALLAGIDGIAIKCHGSTSPQELTHSIKAALSLLTHNFLPHLKTQHL